MVYVKPVIEVFLDPNGRLRYWVARLRDNQNMVETGMSRKVAVSSLLLSLRSNGKPSDPNYYKILELGVGIKK